MRSDRNTDEYLTATTADGMLIIHSLPITLSWVPRDSLNDVYNFGGIVTVGTFDSTDDAKRVAEEQHSVPVGEWRVGDYVEFERNLGRAEVHTPEIKGHKLIGHDIRWE
jgi:hypothetical protein